LGPDLKKLQLFFLIFIFSKFQSYPAVHHIEGSS
jgi:hypothetical protein